MRHMHDVLHEHVRPRARGIMMQPYSEGHRKLGALRRWLYAPVEIVFFEPGELQVVGLPTALNDLRDKSRAIPKGGRW